MILQFSDGEPFATGAASYLYRPATRRETYGRILVSVLVGGIQTHAIVDTGGVFFVCTPEIAAQLGLDARHGAPADKLVLRGRSLNGSLHPLELELVSDDGDPLRVTVTAFVPHLRPGEEWFQDFPCILGLYGCLERLRFAVDPTSETFYFGPAL